MVPQMNAAWNSSIRAFIDAALPRIKVKSGMSGSSLAALAGKVRHRRKVTARVAKGVKTKGHSELSGRFEDNNARWKSRAFGARLGRKSYHVGLMKLDMKDSDLQFHFHLSVYQYYIHENKWGSLEAGLKAFKKRWKEQFEERINGRLVRLFFNG
jgi:hypothetical protein